LRDMKHILITIAAVVLVGCGESVSQRNTKTLRTTQTIPSAACIAAISLKAQQSLAWVLRQEHAEPREDRRALEDVDRVTQTGPVLSLVWTG
jgi:hypothetical protein